MRQSKTCYIKAARKACLTMPFFAGQLMTALEELWGNIDFQGCVKKKHIA